MIGCWILTTGSNGGIIDEANVRMLVELGIPVALKCRHISYLVYNGTHVTDKPG